MPYLNTAQEWLSQSSQLLQARPSTTRITTKYTLKPPKEAAQNKENPSTQVQALGARALLTLKTYDTASGVTLKYKTDKAAEVGRLITILSFLGRSMAGLPKLTEDIEMLNAPPETATRIGSEVQSALEPGGAKGIDGQGGPAPSGKKSKKKGKR